MSASFAEDRSAAASAPLKILLLTSSYAPVLGGLQTVTRALARNLMARGHEVRVVTNRYPRRLPERELLDGVSVQRWQFLRPRLGQLRQGRLDLFLASLYYRPSVQGRLRRLLASFRPDVVNVHFPDAQIPFVLGRKQQFGFRLVVSLHGHEVERFTAEGGRRRDSGSLCALLREADAVTACSGYLLEKARRLEPSVQAKGLVLYNGIDAERFQDSTPYPHPRPYLFAMGRLTRKKGFDLLLQALARIEIPERGLDLLIAGEGEELTALREQAGELGLERRVHFLGRASQEEVIRLLNGCRFQVVPSRVEPFGIVALEGVAAGKGVVATEVGGMAEFLEGEIASWRARQGGSSGPARPAVALVAPTIEGLVEGIRAQLSRPIVQQEAVELSAYVRDHYSWTRVAQRYEGVLAG